MISLICFLLALAVLYTRRKMQKRLPPLYEKVILIVSVMGLALSVKEGLEAGPWFKGEVERPAEGSTEEIREFEARSGTRKTRVSSEIQPKEPDETEADAYFAAAWKEIDESIAGENASLSAVTEDLVLRSSYADGMVQADWSFSDTDRIDYSGQVYTADLTEPVTAEVQVLLKCSEYREERSYAVCLCPPDMESDSGFSEAVRAGAAAAEEENRTEDTVRLPSSIRGMKISWRPVREHTGAALSILALAALFVICTAGLQEKRKAAKERRSLMEAEYPEILNMLYLYIGAGITVRSAFTRIADAGGKEWNEKYYTRHPGRALIRETVRAMDAGATEAEAYRQMGIHADVQAYRKLSLLLLQNLQKGNAHLLGQMEAEAEESRRTAMNRVRESGEKISTKLLLPMTGLLGIVIGILVFPAMQGMNGSF